MVLKLWGGPHWYGMDNHVTHMKLYDVNMIFFFLIIIIIFIILVKKIVANFEVWTISILHEDHFAFGLGHVRRNSAPVCARHCIRSFG